MITDQHKLYEISLKYATTKYPVYTMYRLLQDAGINKYL